MLYTQEGWEGLGIGLRRVHLASRFLGYNHMGYIANNCKGYNITNEVDLVITSLPHIP